MYALLKFPGKYSMLCEHKFLSCMAFSVYEVVHQLRDWHAMQMTS